MSDLDEQAQFFVQKGVRTVSVNGEAEISTEPDFITVTLGVKEQNDDLELARAATLKGIQRVLEVAKTFQFPVEDVQTQKLSSEKVEEIVGEDGIALHGFGESELTSKRRKHEYFIVSLDVMLVVHGPRIEQYDAVMQALLGTGAAIDGESMETTRLGDLRQEARILAVANAKRKAEDLTTGTGVTVGPPIIIRELGRESTGGKDPRRNKWGFMPTGAHTIQTARKSTGGKAPRRQMATQATRHLAHNAGMGEEKEAEKTTAEDITPKIFQLGSIKVASEVEIVFELRVEAETAE